MQEEKMTTLDDGIDRISESFRDLCHLRSGREYEGNISICV